MHTYTCMLARAHTHTHTHTCSYVHIHTNIHKNTHSCEKRATNPILFSIGIRPDAPVGFLYYFYFHHLHTERKPERENQRERGERVRAGEQVSKSMCARHINVRWECEWSCSCETAACCKAQGPLQTYFLSACLDTERNYGSRPWKGCRHVPLDG